jgi:16S rRNA (cytosine1402-N4)-methyltransferase
MTGSHVPVLVGEVTRLATGSQRVLDGTAGLGGHVARFQAMGLEVLAVDRDPNALATAQARLDPSGIRWVLGRFGDQEVLDQVAAFRPDFALLDLGVSSPQLDADERGFSFRPGVPLDMRMEGEGETAAALLNRLPQPELARLFREHADERRAGKLASSIAYRRERHPLRSSDDLVNAIRAALGPRSGPSDFARIFQAVRIVLNDELGQLRTALPAIRDALQPGGRIVVISYHSGEDRIVKQSFREWARACVCPPEQPICTCRGRPLGELDPRRPLRATAAEVAANPRARSAMLRGFRYHGEPSR